MRTFLLLAQSHLEQGRGDLALVNLCKALGEANAAGDGRMRSAIMRAMNYARRVG